MNLSADGRYDHVVGIEFERDTQHRDRFSRQTAAAERVCHFARHRPLALVLDGDNGLNDPQQRLVVLPGLGSAPSCPLESRNRRTPAQRAGFPTYPVVQPNPARDLLDVGADFLREIGDFVDEGNFRWQERSSGFFRF
jgi:hypothetical protein